MENSIIMLITVFLVNLPFGYWRKATLKYSPSWFISIHLPIPLIVYLRFDLGLSLIIIPLSFTLFVLGQYLGGRMRKMIPAENNQSKCLVMDLYRIITR